MANTTLVNKIGQHYLQVQALTPVGSETAVVVNEADSAYTWRQLALPSLIVFIVIILVGMAFLLFTRSRNPNKLLIVASLAFFTSILPLGLYALNQKTQLPSQADASLVPTQVVVDQVSPQVFNVTWTTAKASQGLISLKPLTSPDLERQVVRESPESDVYTHSITLPNLKARTVYELLILSGGVWYGLDGQPLKLTTK